MGNNYFITLSIRDNQGEMMMKVVLNNFCAENYIILKCTQGDKSSIKTDILVTYKIKK